MHFLIIGSLAAKKYIPNFREPKDIDVFTPPTCLLDSESYFGGDLKVEPFWHESFNEWIPSRTARFATLDELYTIKISHSNWALNNGSWEKHMQDAMLLKSAGAKLDLDLYKLLYKVWEEKHGKKRLDLDMTKDDFFADAVTRKYDHDSLHYSVAYGDKPMYESVLKDGAQIDIDMRKVRVLPFEQQVKLYREEVYATALERWVVPSDYKFSPRKAYAFALKKTITSLTKGWSARFLAEHYDIFRIPDVDYIKVHKQKSHLLIPLEK